MIKEKQTIFNITRELKVSAPDEFIYEEAEHKLNKFWQNPNDQELKKELKVMEGILWQRFKQLSGWIQLVKIKNAENPELWNLRVRRNECAIKINALREALNEKKIGEDEISRYIWKVFSI